MSEPHLLGRVVRSHRLSSTCCQWGAGGAIALPIRSFTTTARLSSPAVENSITSSPVDDVPPPSSSNSPFAGSRAKAAFNLPDLDPNTAHDRRSERVLMRSGTPPIGSRRRRAAVASTSHLLFEQMPYQCFQEARKVLLEDRREKLAQIGTQRARIERLKASDIEKTQGKLLKEKRLKSMTLKLEELKILADVNDPMVKKRFEDGEGDLNRPIYRHYALKKWRSRRRLILDQRVQQLHVVPDLLPRLDITVDTALSFGRIAIAPGAMVPSTFSLRAPKLTIQPFDRGTRLVTIAVVDPDVPNTETDAFDTRLHFLACNVPISPVDIVVRLGDFVRKQGDVEAGPKADCTVQEWSPPYAQKGSPYHRLCLIVLEQPKGQEPQSMPHHQRSSTDAPLEDPSKAAVDPPLEVTGASRSQDIGRAIDVSWQRSRMEQGKGLGTDGGIIKQLMSLYRLKPVGAFIFRTQWDEGMDGVLGKLGVEGAGVELKRKRVEPLPYKKKDGERYR